MSFRVQTVKRFWQECGVFMAEKKGGKERRIKKRIKKEKTDGAGHFFR